MSLIGSHSSRPFFDRCREEEAACRPKGKEAANVRGGKQGWLASRRQAKSGGRPGRGGGTTRAAACHRAAAGRRTA